MSLCFSDFMLSFTRRSTYYSQDALSTTAFQRAVLITALVRALWWRRLALVLVMDSDTKSLIPSALVNELRMLFKLPPAYNTSDLMLKVSAKIVVPVSLFSIQLQEFNSCVLVWSISASSFWQPCLRASLRQKEADYWLCINSAKSNPFSPFSCTFWPKPRSCQWSWLILCLFYSWVQKFVVF